MMMFLVSNILLYFFYLHIIKVWTCNFKAIRYFGCGYRKLHSERNLVNFACLGAIALQFNSIIFRIGLQLSLFVCKFHPNLGQFESTQNVVFVCEISVRY